jgi:hypothetical protein
LGKKTPGGKNPAGGFLSMDSAELSGKIIVTIIIAKNIVVLGFAVVPMVCCMGAIYCYWGV